MGTTIIKEFQVFLFDLLYEQKTLIMDQKFRFLIYYKDTTCYWRIYGSFIWSVIKKTTISGEF
jgi:hypothetical protein